LSGKATTTFVSAVLIFQVIEHEWDSPKVNVFCAISHHKIYGSFLFAEESIKGNIHLDMLINWLMPQLYE
jgi:hypothetical protein